MTISIVKMYIFIISLIFGCVNSWNIGSGVTYDITTSLLMGEMPQFINTSIGDVGFQITGKLKVLPIWKDPADPSTILLSIKSESLKLWIKSRKAPRPEGFIKHDSRIEEITEDAIVILWKDGEIKKIFAVYAETLSSLNLKRGFASIFQYKNRPDVVQETDASGVCTVSYNTLSSRSVEKIKKNCDRHKIHNPNPILGVNLKSVYRSTYDFTESSIPKLVMEDEKHVMSLTAKQEARTSVTTHRILQLVPGSISGSSITAPTFAEALRKLDSRYMEVSFKAETERMACPESGCPTLNSVLDSSRSALDTSVLGTIKSAHAFLKLVPLIRNTSAETLTKILKSPRNHNILPQLYDLYGSASSPAAHQAAMKALRQDNIGDNTERYLWAVSMSPYQDSDIIKDILTRSEETPQNDKVSETLALSAAAMAKRYGSLSVIEKVKNSLEIGLETCTSEECKMKFLRALGNLGSKTVIPTLLKYATGQGRVMGIIAWKAMGNMKAEYVTDEIKSLAMKTFLELGKQRVDSSIRALALNVIVKNNPTVEDLRVLLLYLTNPDSMYEIKKYLVQRFEQLSNDDMAFRRKFKIAIQKESSKVNNYHAFAQRGLSTAFTRTFLNSVSSNGSIVTIQEIKGGLLKRGIVDVVLESNSYKYTLFSLGLFAGGLDSFMSSSDQEENEIPPENEVATAGMEISFLDVDIRPFIFFSGQGELMGHVWSGTASEKTPAFQTTVNLHRHRELIALASGFVVEVDVEGAMSVDLSGKISLSLWSRNAQSVVEMGAGIAIQGGNKIITDFVHSRAEFTLTLEPKLELATDVDFSGPISLCMRSSQPDVFVKHNIYKVERIPGSRHRLRKTRRISIISPAKSYLLNKKNNEMCSKVFN
ncbi:microsomal triacylglycerol transfer protein [Phymastichus coffea]|uniref:microsomal triacylglycerol transfer protein n=1 Tax=Phymastichus coffea TaxID=108790 RepID=UPI00273C443B|nr:microsomal triacylglycerol transfer protein [Phymastichus coffea]